MGLALLLVVCAGCGRDDTIARYSVEHGDRVGLRMLAAIIPDGNQSWFVVISGPEETVTKQKDAFGNFLQSLRLDPSKEQPLTWKEPTGWKVQPARADRLAWFIIDGPPTAVEVKLSRFGGSVLDNVNRWRKQLNLPPVDGKELLEQAQRQKLADRDMFVVDLAGVGDFTPPRPAPVHHGMSPAKTSRLLVFQAPAGWQKQATPKFPASESYLIEDPKGPVEVTLTPLGGSGGGMAANVNRWRGQVGLPPTDETAIAKEMQTLEMAGGKGNYVDVGNPQSDKQNNRILGVILPVGESTWFLKMTGPFEAVGRQKTNFETFAKSCKVDGQ